MSSRCVKVFRFVSRKQSRRSCRAVAHTALKTRQEDRKKYKKVLQKNKQIILQIKRQQVRVNSVNSVLSYINYSINRILTVIPNKSHKQYSQQFTVQVIVSERSSHESAAKQKSDRYLILVMMLSGFQVMLSEFHVSRFLKGSGPAGPAELVPLQLLRREKKIELDKERAAK